MAFRLPAGKPRDPIGHRQQAVQTDARLDATLGEGEQVDHVPDSREQHHE